MHPVSIYDHPPSMNARGRISQPIKNVIYVNEWLFILFTSQVIYVIIKIIYFSVKVFAGREIDGTVRSTVCVLRNGMECGSGFFARFGSGPIFSAPCHSLVQIKLCLLSSHGPIAKKIRGKAVPILWKPISHARDMAKNSLNLVRILYINML